jgi:hypothetical protein
MELELLDTARKSCSELRGMTIGGLSTLGSCQMSLESDHSFLIDLRAQHTSLL